MLRSSDPREGIRELAYRIRPSDPLDALMERIGDARLVLLGEASHGTHEYYTFRTRITQRLVREKGFRFVAVEGDWPDCYEINRYIKGWSGESSALEVLRRFDRWPTWMWANWEVNALVEWLKRENEGRPEQERIGFYGLDVYSLWESLDVVFRHLRESHPTALPIANEAMRCFAPYRREAQSYAWATRLVPSTCEREVLQLLNDLRSRPAEHPDDPEAHFNALQNAETVVGAERYYRAMIGADGESWNVRDVHMSDTLDRLLRYLGPNAKAVVWEHNTHVGDARYTDMAAAGMVNVGQLVRERHAEAGVVIVGFGSYRGSVVAGDAWGAPMETMVVPEARSGSWEHLLHEATHDDILLISDDLKNDERFDHARGHRAIGVVYHPEREEYGNYVPTVLAERYDAFIHLEETRALHPLNNPAQGEEPPETYPFGV